MYLVGITPARDLHDRTSLLGARLILNLLGALAHAGRIGGGSDLAETRRRAAPAVAPAGGPALIGGRS
jgi:hypothetical protein